MKVLLIINNLRVNGVKTFTHHLWRGLNELPGVRCDIVKTIGVKKTEHTLRKYVRTPSSQSHYRNMCKHDLFNSLKEYDIIHVVDTEPPDNAILRNLAEAGAVNTIHQSNELGLTYPDYRKTLTIRKKLQATVPGSVYLPHPYAREFTAPAKKSKQAIAATRLDTVKKTAWILEAKKAGADIDLYGELMPFYGMTLDNKFPGWRDNWLRKFPVGRAFELLRHYRMSVDLTSFRNDGAGTQYSFLEAWDAQCAPVIYSSFSGGPLKHGITCYVIESVEELVAVLAKKRTNLDRDEIDRLLVRHKATTIAKKYIEEMRP